MAALLAHITLQYGFPGSGLQCKGTSQYPCPSMPSRSFWNISSGTLNMAAFGMGAQPADEEISVSQQQQDPDISSGMLDLAAFGMGPQTPAPHKPQQTRPSGAAKSPQASSGEPPGTAEGHAWCLLPKLLACTM